MEKKENPSPHRKQDNMTRERNTLPTNGRYCNEEVVTEADYRPASCAAAALMPPGPVYNWCCVLYSVAEIIGHATRYRGVQIPLKTPSDPIETPLRKDVSAQILRVPLITSESLQSQPIESRIAQERVQDVVKPPETSLPSGITRSLKSSKVPSSRIGRLLHYGGSCSLLHN